MPKLREPPKRDDEALAKDGSILAGQSGNQDDVVVIAQDDGVEELNRQIEALRKSEASAKAQAAQSLIERDAAVRQTREHNVAMERSQKEASDSRLEAIQSGMAAAEAEIEDSKRAFRMAVIEQDVDAQVLAQEKMTEAKVNLANLTNGKAALERSIQEEKDRPKVEVQQGDALDQTNLPQTAKTWLRAHPEYLTDQRKNAKIQSLHWDVIDEGHHAFSDSYYESLEQHLGMKEKPRRNAAEDDTDDDPTRRPIVSAPVSREALSSTGTRTGAPVRLTVAQREAAKMAGITETEYAKQLGVLNQAKANGNYGGAP